MITSKKINAITAVILTIAVLFTTVMTLFPQSVGVSVSATASKLTYAEELFQKDSVMQIDISVDQDTWNTMLENATSEEYICCDVTINGTKYSSVGVRPKGNSSLTQVSSSDSERYSLKFELDHYIEGQTCNGLDKFVANNMQGDATYMKEYLSYMLMDYVGVTSPLYCFSNINVNGEDWGFYLAVESLEDSFIERNYGTDHGDLYKVESDNMGGGNKDDNGGAQMKAAQGNGMDNTGAQNKQDSSSSQSNSSTASSQTQQSGGNSPQTPQGGNTTQNGGNAPQMPQGGNTTQNGGNAPQMAQGGNATQNGGNAPQMPQGGNTTQSGSNAPQMPQGGNTTQSGGNAPQMAQGGNTTQNGGNATQMPQGGSTTQNGGNATQMPQGGNTTQNGTSSTDASSSQASDNGSPAASNNNNQAATNGFGENMQNGKGGGMGRFGTSGTGGDLVYSDDNSSSYSAIFNNSVFDSNEEDYQRVITAIKNLNEGTNLEEYVDVDQALRYIAANTVLVNLDSYFSSMQHNYYIYEKDGQISILPWDYNLSFAGFQSNNSSSAVNFAIDTPVSGTEISQRPLISKLLEVEEYKNRYHQYLQEIVDGFFNSSLFENTINSLNTLIGSYVQSDPSAFYTYDQYTSSLNTLKAFGKLRAQSIQGQLDGTIPSTTAGQTADSSKLIDASSINISNMGSQGGGNGGGKDNAGGDTTVNGQGNAPQMPNRTAQNGAAGNAAGNGTQNNNGGAFPAQGGNGQQMENTQNMQDMPDMSVMKQAMEILQSSGGTTITEDQKKQLSALGLSEAQITNLQKLAQNMGDNNNKGNFGKDNNTAGPQGSPSTSQNNPSALWLSGASILALAGGLIFVIVFKRRKYVKSE